MRRNDFGAFLRAQPPPAKRALPEAASGAMSRSRARAPMLDRIGETSLIELGSIVPAGSARLSIKLESENPTGSMKDRMALAMIEAAEADGRLPPGGRVVEYTAGSTGVSLAFVCAATGHPLELVTSDAFSLEKRNQMAAYGATLTLVPSDGGRMDASLTRRMIAAASEIAERTGAFFVDQLANADQLSAYHRMGAEIWRQTDGELNAFVQSTGTAASSRGVSEALRERDPEVLCVAVEPAESAVLSGGPPGAHRIEGVGAGFVVPLWRPEAIDEIEAVSTDEAMAMARRLAREEALFAGTSTGANVVAALRVARRLGPGRRVVTLMCDSGIKYVTTELYGR